jgi:hypothetical protein
MGQRDSKPSMQIMVSWYVTNAADTPVRILAAGLIIPNPAGRTCCSFVYIVERRTNFIRTGMDMAISPGKTETVEASFFLDPPTQKENQLLKVRMYIVDQFGRKHKAPKIKLTYKVLLAETY